MFDRDAMIAHYNQQRDEFVEVLRSLRPEDLDKPTVCEGWTVKDLVAHMATSASTVQLLMNRHIAREPNPGLAALNERNAQGVAARKAQSVEESLAELLSWHDKNVAFLRSLSDEHLAVENSLVNGSVIPTAQRFTNSANHYGEHSQQILQAIGRGSKA